MILCQVMQGTKDMAETQIGTPYYLSPEMYRDEPYGQKSDVWSLGIMLYEILMLELPFQAKHLPGLARKVLKQDPAPIDPDRYCGAMQELVSDLLLKDPRARPSVDEILARPFLLV